MARAAIPGRLTWRAATLVRDRWETPSARTLVLDVPEWPGHAAGQHVDVRLTAPDGYRAQRSYSIASAWPAAPAPAGRPEGAQPEDVQTEEAQPEDGRPEGTPLKGARAEGARPEGAQPDGGRPDGGRPGSNSTGNGHAPSGREIELTVQRLDDGEVSPYLTDVLEVGEQLELRGPVGGWFVWRDRQTAPVLLLAGGSGVVPLMAMVRARGTAHGRQPFRLIYSVRTPEDACYAAELARRVRDEPGLDVHYVYTRKTPDGWPQPPRRIDLAAINTYGWPPGFEPDCYVCGPTAFVETAADILVALGHDPQRIRTERFGGTSS